MVELLIIYTIFCITTSLTAVFHLLVPTLSKLKKEHPLNNLIQNTYITYMVFFLIGILIAPILLIPAIIPTYSETFKDTLYDSIKG